MFLTYFVEDLVLLITYGVLLLVLISYPNALPLRSAACY